MSRVYVSVLAVAPPEPLGVFDAGNRHVFSLNVECEVSGIESSRQLAEDLIAICNTYLTTVAGAVLLDHTTSAKNTFIGLNASIPSGAGPFSTFIPSGGEMDRITHNGGESRVGVSTAQITVRATAFNAADSHIHNLWRALNGRYNIEVG